MYINIWTVSFAHPGCLYWTITQPKMFT